MAGKKNFVQLAVEQVEERLMLAGSVEVDASGNTLRITGDTAANDVAVVELSAAGAKALNAKFGSKAAAGDYLVIGQNNTHLTAGSDVVVRNLNKGSLTDIAIAPHQQDITIRTRGGGDAVTIGVSPGFGGTKSPFTAAEQKLLKAISAPLTAGTLTIRTAADNDLVQIADTRIQSFQKVKVVTAGGSENMLAANSKISGNLVVRTGAANDKLDIVGITVGGNTNIAMGAGNDVLTFAGPTSKFAGSFRAVGGPGDDTLVRTTPPAIADPHPVIRFDHVV
jgi:hypothetical protein